MNGQEMMFRENEGDNDSNSQQMEEQPTQEQERKFHSKYSIYIYPNWFNFENLQVEVVEALLAILHSVDQARALLLCVGLILTIQAIKYVKK